ncbi:MAG: FAD-dependent monooxygenase [Kutzneria sp.]|nr:FAD-dependent monooxygenase [Kutzneria sp.]
MRDTDVLICGAGIAGTTLAYWLSRSGFKPTVVEHAPAPRPGGQAVDLRGAGRIVVERMGLLGRVRAIGLEQHGLALVGSTGRIAARLPTESFGGEGIVSEIEVLRGDLCEVLYEATLPHTEYLFSDTITGIQQRPDGVTVTFDKSPRRRFGLVVGADGLHSAVRGLVFGPESHCVRPLGCYTAWFTADTDVELDGWFLMYNAPGGLVVSARPGRLAGEIKAGLSFRSPPIAYDRGDLTGQRNIVARRFAGIGWETPRLLNAMRAASDFFFDSMGRVYLDCWSRDRVTLVGDAAYCSTPLTGLGTSLALVGAYVLAGELATAGGDHDVAFSRYQSVMRPYVTRGQQLPPGGLAGFAPRNRVVIRSRALTMHWMTRWPFRKLFAAQFGKASGIVLPDYSAVIPTRSGP